MEMKLAVDYRKLRFHNLHSEPYRHLYYLIFWPIFGMLFYGVERFWIRDNYLPIQCGLDDMIPFCEYFLIPYLLWFVYLLGIHIYTVLFDVRAFKRMMQFIIVTYGLTLLIYILFPNCQQLRPVVFERDNVFTHIMAAYYQFDTNTNVLPSLHVIGSVAVMFAAWDSKHFSTRGWKIIFFLVTVWISISTVFLKQHSVLDMAAAIPVCMAGYLLAYRHMFSIMAPIRLRNAR